MCLATAELLFNVTAPNVALPDIGASLGAGFGELQWVLSAYALLLASLLLAGGSLGDRYGRKRFFVTGLGLFALASAACALAPSGIALIAARAAQGVAAAVLFPAGLALIAAEFEAGRERARAIGVWGASVSGAIAIGPLGGGLLVDHLGWRSIFWVDAALTAAAVVPAARQLRESRSSGGGRLDWAGTVVLTLALFLIVFAVLRGNAMGWTSPAVAGSFAAGAILAAAFLALEHRVANPLIAPALMRNRTFIAATGVAFLFAAGGFGPLVYVTLFLLDVVGSTPTEAGLQLVPFAAAAFLVSLLAAPIAARAGTRVTLAIGLALCAGGLLLMHGVGAHSGWERLLPGLVVFGAGGGLVNPTMTVAALSVVPPAQSGMASGVNNTARQFGIATGIAALGAALQAHLESDLRDRLAATPLGPAARSLAHRAADGDVAGALAAAGARGRVLFADAYREAFVSALNIVFLLAAGAAVAGVVLVVALVHPATGREVAAAQRPARARAD